MLLLLLLLFMIIIVFHIRFVFVDAEERQNLIGQEEHRERNPNRFRPSSRGGFAWMPRLLMSFFAPRANLVRPSEPTTVETMRRGTKSARKDGSEKHSSIGARMQKWME